jgi:hypothetical protein
LPIRQARSNHAEFFSRRANYGFAACHKDKA